MHNIQYWDVHTGTMKIAKHDSKDEIQYGDNIENRSPASTHLMEVFTGSVDHTTNTQPEKLDLKLTDQSSPSPNDILMICSSTHHFHTQQKQQQQPKL